MAENDTPTEPLHARRVNTSDHGAAVDLAFMWEFRRDVQAGLDAARKESSLAMTEVRTRLSGIESRQIEGKAVTEKHSDQIAELIDQAFEQEQRITKAEKDGGSGLVRRVTQMEADLRNILGKLKEAADLAHERERASRNSTPRKMLIGALVAGAATVGGGTPVFLWWAIKLVLEAKKAAGG